MQSKYMPDFSERRAGSAAEMRNKPRPRCCQTNPRPLIMSGLFTTNKRLSSKNIAHDERFGFVWRLPPKDDLLLREEPSRHQKENQRESSGANGSNNIVNNRRRLAPHNVGGQRILPENWNRRQ